MYAVLRAVPLALGSLFAISIIRAQVGALPPIFAPRVTTVTESPVPRGRPAAPALVSERARSLIHAAAVRVLESAMVFDAPIVAGDSVVDATTGTTVMAPMIVRGTPLTDSQVRPPVLRLMHFEPAAGDKHRRLAGGVTAPIFHTFFGKKEMQVDFSILNGAGNGIDHHIDFVRAEIAFRFKW